jgi:energy-coupling factor transporter transmembrane protein EcfT
VGGNRNTARREAVKKKGRSKCCKVLFATSGKEEGSAGGGGGSAGQRAAKSRKFDGISQLLNQVVTATSIPYVTYVPEPRSPLHFVDARVKQILAFACLVAAARGTLEIRFAMCLGVGMASLLCLPKSYSLKQLLGVVKLCVVVGIFTLLAADAVNVPIQERIPTDAVMSGVEALKDHTTYKYTLLNLGIFKITRRSVNLAAAACALQFATIQSSVICLTTTSPEELTKAYTQFFLVPFRWLRLVNVSELSLSILLSFRFLGLIFEELQNIAKGMLARNISWKDLTLVSKVDIGTTLITKAVNNLLSISSQIARSMMARGYNASTFTHPHLNDVGPERRRR